MTRCNLHHRSAMPHEGRIETAAPLRFTWGQVAIIAYCVGIVSGGIGASLYFTEPSAGSPVAVSNSRVAEAGAGNLGAR